MREYMNIFRGLNEINRHDINFKWILQSIGLVFHCVQPMDMPMPCMVSGISMGRGWGMHQPEFFKRRALQGTKTE
jgi:hypothetical protein